MSRRLAPLALLIAYAHTVLGAIVRISGSGMGCGEHWPDCNSQVLPTLGSTATIIEFSHRLLAATLVVTLVALVVSAMRERSSLRGPAMLALATTVTAALLGALIVALSLANPYLIAVHYALAMLLLGTLVVANVRVGWLGASEVRVGDASRRTVRSTWAGAALTFVVVVFGALVANVPGAAESCLEFPWCGQARVTGVPLALHATHRVLATLLLLHLFSVWWFGPRKRGEGEVIETATRLASQAVSLQVVLGIVLVETHLDALMQSVHQAVGTLVWIAAVTAAALAKQAEEPVAVGAPELRTT